MSREINPRELSDAAIKALLAQNLCPACMGELDTGWECNKCNYDAMPLVERLMTTRNYPHPKIIYPGSGPR